jgi:lactate dehydrogenase-like 2-hydroxyacid dehydrogenase
MFFNDSDIDAIINLKRDIDDIRKKIIEDNKQIQEFTKQFLGEQISEETMAKIIDQEISQEIARRIRRDILGGE